MYISTAYVCRWRWLGTEHTWKRGETGQVGTAVRKAWTFCTRLADGEVGWIDTRTYIRYSRYPKSLTKGVWHLAYIAEKIWVDMRTCGPQGGKSGRGGCYFKDIKIKGKERPRRAKRRNRKNRWVPRTVETMVKWKLCDENKLHGIWFSSNWTEFDEQPASSSIKKLRTPQSWK